MATPQIGVFQDQGGAVYNVAAYGAVGDGRPLDIASAAAGDTTLTVPAGGLSSADAGKIILIPLGTTLPWKRGGNHIPVPATLITSIASISISGSTATITLADALTVAVKGVKALYGTDASPAIAQALQAAADADGGTVFVPPGTYLLGGGQRHHALSLSSGVSLRGTGPGSRLVLAGVGTGVLMEGVRDCAVRDLGIDLFNTMVFLTAIQAKPASDGTWCQEVRVQGCSLYNSLCRHSPAYVTSHAVVLAGCDRVWITGNYTEGVELKCALGPGVSSVHVTGNTIVNPLQYGVSVATTSGPVTDCVIANNVFRDVQHSAIYVGDDSGNGADVTCERVSILGNVITGHPAGIGSFIQLRIPRQARDWIIKDNVVRVTGGKTCGVSGIYAAPRGAATAVLSNLVIAGNAVSGTDQPGICLDASRGQQREAQGACEIGPPRPDSQPQGNGFLIQGNVVDGTAGIAVINQYTPQVAYWNGRIAGNVVRGGCVALLNGGPVDICDNLIDTAASPAVIVATAAEALAAAKQANPASPLTSAAGAGIVLGGVNAGTGNDGVTAMVCNNRIRNGTGNATLVNGILEAGDASATFDVVYAGNVITDNTGTAIQTIASTGSSTGGSTGGAADPLQGIAVAGAGAGTPAQ